MQIPAGWLVDRFGVRRAYSLGFVFWSMTSALTGLVNGFAALLGVRVALGAGQAISFPASSRAVANWFQESERGTVSGGMQNFGGNLGGILAPAVTGFIAHKTGSFAMALGLVGVVLVVGMLAYWFLIDDKVNLDEAAAL
jgi:ACS family D-galactonate transporter-like MFS transporter